MFKKIKKHRLSLFLLAMVMMLSVYYVLMPTDEGSLPVDGGDTNFVRYQQFGQLRLEIIDERATEVALYQSKISEATVSVSEKEEYMLEIEVLANLTEKEVSLEQEVILLGYEDTLVFFDDGILNISVLNDGSTKEETVQIILIAKEAFKEASKVMVNFIDTSS